MSVRAAGQSVPVIVMLALTLMTGSRSPAAELVKNHGRSLETAGHTGTPVYGNAYFGDLDDSAPLVLLFHQGGSNGRGEYGELMPWLNEHGLRAITWDARAGGDLYGATNRTQDALAEGTPDHYCDAYSDLEAALDYVTGNRIAEKVIIWGSSYSGALVFRLAAENPDSILAVFAFSPASGGPMVDCRARQWVEQVAAPKVVFKPTMEMERETSIEQKAILEKAGTDFLIVKDGIHGSSMLLDERAEHDMSATRALVISKISEILDTTGN